MAAVAVAWLRAAGWVVYQEVEYRGDIADIVATRGEEVAVVEAKLALGLTVLAQGDRWKGRAHFIYVATPGYSARVARSFGATVCRALGLGLLEIDPPFFEHEAGRVRVAAEPVRDENAAHGALLATLRPEHETYAAAGSPTGHRWSTFRESERNLVAYVIEHPGELAALVMKKIKHHWRGSSPQSTVMALIRRGVITGIRAELGAGVVGGSRGARFFPVAPAVEVAPAAPLAPGLDVASVPDGGSAPKPPAAAPRAPASSTAISSPTTSRRRRSRTWRR